MMKSKNLFILRRLTIWDKFFLTLLFLLFTGNLLAQNTKIIGVVTDVETSEPIPGVSINLKGTKTTALTNMDGKYSIEVNEGNNVLMFSFFGYETVEMPISDQTIINVALQPEATGLHEVVVIGYDTQRKGDITSSIVSVKEKDFTVGAIRDAGDLIKGKVAGLIISNTSGDPTAGANLSLRGVSSLKGNSRPLVLINGIPGDLNTVAPEEIQSIDVLKDASAAAIYGTRGANGVIIITTKSVDRNAMLKVNYNPYFSVSNFVRKAEFCTASDLREIRGLGWTLPFVDEGADTDWLKEITRTGFTQNHNINVSGGTSKASYVANASYNKMDGVFKKSNNEELKLSFDMNQFMFDDKFKININVIHGTQKYGALGNGYSIDNRIYRNALIRNPSSPVKDINGNWAEDKTVLQYYNPLGWIEETDGLNQQGWTRLTSNLTLTPITGWETNLMLSKDSWNQFRGYSESKKHWSNTLEGRNGFASKGSSKSTTDFLDLTSKYSKNIEEHRITVLAGYSYQYNINEGLWASNRDFPSDVFSYDNLNVGSALKDGKADMGSSKNENTLIGFFGRVSYGFNDRYNVMASIRKEGSSKLGANNKWGTFPSFSAGWTISNESFMSGVSFINNLKLRAGYGITGIIPSNSYMSLTLLRYQDPFYFNGKWVKSLAPERNPNPDLRWEKSTEINIGVDFALMNSRISGSVEIYKKSTIDLLWDYPVPVPPNLVGTTLANVGELENKGVELVLNTTPVRTNDIEWNSNITFSHNKNEVISLENDLYQFAGQRDYLDVAWCSDPITMATHRIEPGRAIGDFWGAKTVDITKTGQWIIESATGKRDTLTSALYDDANRQYLGNGIPKFNLSWVNSFRYKGFDLNAVITSALGFQILNQQRMFYENKNISYNRLKSAYWLVYDKAVLNYFQQTWVSYYLEDGDYVKLDNLTIGYTIKSNKTKYLKSLRFYASGSNLITLTKYKGIDPEITNYNKLGQGSDDRDKYPSLRTFTFGLNVTF
jgi:TonB-dependent starch-binding outer membrane protein SusC